MTSIPASRSARAMIFAPRSWPSRPGFATTTRIFLSVEEDILRPAAAALRARDSKSERRRLAVGPEHDLQGLHHFPLGGVRARGLEQPRHQVLVGVTRGLLQPLERCRRARLV